MLDGGRKKSNNRFPEVVFLEQVEKGARKVSSLDVVGWITFFLSALLLHYRKV